jgi:hypothetical protein
MPLTGVEIKNLRPEEKRYIRSDGRGLAIEVMPTGAASWRYRYQFRGKTEKVSIGPYSLVSLKEARHKRDEQAAMVFRGESPLREVSAQDVQRLVFRKRNNGFEAAAAEMRNLIKRIFDYAIVCGFVTVNPAAVAGGGQLQIVPGIGSGNIGGVAVGGVPSCAYVAQQRRTPLRNE